MNINPLITQAITHLKTHPFDAAHDLAHHKRVWQNAQKIAKHLSHQTPSIKINLNALKLACFWHDVVIKTKDELNPAGKNVSETADYLRKQMQSLNYDKGFIDTVYLAVRYHQYDDTPVNLEGQILWDADKLDVVHHARWFGAHQAVEKGTLDPFYAQAMVETGARWIKVLPQKFHFPISAKLFHQELSQTLADPKAKQMLKKYNIQIHQLLK
jgi:hypothetical protein